LCALPLALVPTMPAVGSQAIGTQDGPDRVSRGDLDGRVFVGSFGPADRPGDRADSLTFDDGHFWSANCVPCGFGPAPYWIRRVGDELHFRGEMDSVERGRFRYAGVIRDGRVSATIHWRKERWYWTIDREFRFEGRRADTVHSDPLAAVVRRARAAAAAPEPSAVCPL
jgi:hypothetical protein